MIRFLQYLFLGLVLTLLVFIAVLQKRIAHTTAEIELREEIGKSVATKRSQVATLEQKIENREIEIGQKAISLEGETDVARIVESEADSETMALAGNVEAWMARANRLGQFLHLYPQYRIAEIDSLTPHDWLTVAKAGSLKTEADYRIALSRLRDLLKRRTSNAITDAWKAFETETDGKSLTDFSLLSEYSDGLLKLGMLDRFRLKTDADELGMVIITEGSQVTFVDDPVDPLWDTMTIARIGGVGLTPRGPWQAKERIEKALAQYVAEMGRNPINSDEIAPYIENEEILAVLPEMYQAMTTYPEFVVSTVI